MASGMGTNDPPPIPPPDFTPVSTEEFAKQQMPPLHGIMVDPQFPPTVAEANAVLRKSRERERESQANQDNQPEVNVHRTSGASQIFGTSPTIDEVVNTMPFGTRHTAGGESLERPNIITGLKSIKKEDWKSFHKIPCVREALLQGMTAGFFVGAVMFVLGRPAARAANWAVGIFVPTSFIGHSYCQRQRRLEREGMKTAVQIIEQKKEEKRRLMEEKRERFRIAKEERRMLEDRKAREEAGRRGNWWSVWRGGGGREG